MRWGLVAFPMLAVTGCGRVGFALLDTSGADGGLVVSDVPSSCAWSAWQEPTLVGELEATEDTGDPALRSDGLEIVFARGTVPDTDLFHARRDSVLEPFGPSVLLGALSTAGKDCGPALSRDGLTLYWMSDITGIRLWRATRSDVSLEFVNPEPLPGGPFDEQSDPSITADGLELFQSSSAGQLYASTRPTTSDAFGEPVLLPAPVGSPDWQEGPSISKDGTALYFTQVDGSGLYTIRLATRGDPSAPFGVSEVVPELEVGQSWDPEISADGSTLYFSRYTFGKRDIWVTHRECL